MVEVEHTAHEEERQVMETPTQEQPPSTRQEMVDISCKENPSESR